MPDILRPRCHFLPPSNWMNDPNGLIHWKGIYHLFYQYNPVEAVWGPMHWGHARSPDLVHWEHLPIALAPGAAAGGGDKDGVFSGCAVNDNGVPTLVYTGVHPECQCLATPLDDDLIRWGKYPGNPVIPSRPAGLELEGFRDPCVWKEGDAWWMVLGSGIKGRGGTILLYRSSDLHHWEYLHPVLVGDPAEVGMYAAGTMWECPQFFPVSASDGERRVLLVSAMLPGREPLVLQFSGEYKDGFFKPLTGPLPFEFGEDVFYAPQSFRDAGGRRLLFGWLREARSREAHRAAGWAGVMSLPLLLTPRPDGRCGIAPTPEVDLLRGRHIVPGVQPAQGETVVPDLDSSELEIDLTVEPGDAAAFGFKLCCGEDEQTQIFYDVYKECLVVDTTASSLDAETHRGVKTCHLPLAKGEMLRLRLYLDHSVLEVFANDWAYLATRLYPSRAQSLGTTCSAVRWFVQGGSVKISSFDAWRLKPVWG